MVKDYFSFKLKIVLGFLILLVLGGIFVTLKYEPVKEESLGEITSLEREIVFEKNKVFSFEINNESYQVRLNNIEQNSAEITIEKSPKIVLFFDFGETKLADLNNDGVYELSLRLENVLGENAYFLIQKIEDLKCIESWTCTNYGACILGTKKRICIEENACKTEENKPAIEEPCELPEQEEFDLNFTCSQLGGNICSILKDCSGEIIFASDSNLCCNNNCVNSSE